MMQEYKKEKSAAVYPVSFWKDIVYDGVKLYWQLWVYLIGESFERIFYRRLEHKVKDIINKKQP